MGTVGTSRSKSFLASSGTYVVSYSSLKCFLMVSKSRNQIIVGMYTPSGIFLFNNCTPSKPTGFGFNISKDLCRHQLLICRSISLAGNAVPDAYNHGLDVLCLRRLLNFFSISTCKVLLQFFKRSFRSFNIIYNKTFIQHHDTFTNFGNMNKVMAGN